MITICPTVLAGEPHEFREQMERITPFVRRIQIDLMDGVFAPTKSIDLAKVWLPQAVAADIHLMYQKPAEHLERLVELEPHMVIVHAEADVNHVDFAAELHGHGIKAGLALLKDTPVAQVSEILGSFDHLLIFSGDLGRFGGVADLGLLDKIQQAKAQYPQLEIGWDGGINVDNAAELARGGVDVLNVGGFIQNASNPEEAYGTLEALVLLKRQ